MHLWEALPSLFERRFSSHQPTPLRNLPKAFQCDTLVGEISDREFELW